MKKIILSALALVACVSVSAQQYRTMYFMDNAKVRTELNPAMTPDQGYVSIPVLGGMSAQVSSDISLDNVLYVRGGELVTFMDSRVDASSLLSNISENNRLSVSQQTRILGFGFYSGQKSYITFDLNLKTEASSNLPGDIFEFMKKGSGLEGASYDASGLGFSADSYAELALGYAHKVNENLTVAVKLKYLAGLAHVSMNFDKLDINLSDSEWSIVSEGSFEASAGGLTIGQSVEDGSRELNFDDIDYSFDGLAGSGFAIDLGAEYNLFDLVKISASVLNLGAISWKDDATTSGVSQSSYSFSGFNVENGVDSNTSLTENFDDFLRFTPTTSNAAKSSLITTLLLAGEYQVFDKYLKAGAMYTYQMRETYNNSQLMVVATTEPISCFSAALSYSLLGQSGSGQTIGLAINFHPSFFDLYVGTDFMIGEVTPQYVPVSQGCANFYFGISIPLTKRPM